MWEGPKTCDDCVVYLKILNKIIKILFSLSCLEL